MSAVFMHKMTYALSYGGCGTLTVTKNGKEYTYTPREDFIEVDELIAVPVQTLNRKGYKTACCCAGHAPGHLFPIAKVENEAITVTDYAWDPWNTATYITFDKEYAFPFLPKGFTRQKNKIFKEYDKTENAEWQTMLAIMESAKTLHEWADALPPLSESQKAM